MKSTIINNHSPLANISSPSPTGRGGRGVRGFTRWIREFVTRCRGVMGFTPTIIIFVILLSGCVTKRACDRRFPPVEKDSVREIIKTVTTYRDTTIFIAIKGDTVYKESIARPGEINRLKSPLASSEAWISNGKLIHRLTQKDTIIPSTLENAVKTTTTASVRERIVHQIKKVNELTKWQWVQIWIGRVILSLLLIRLIINRFLK